MRIEKCILKYRSRRIRITQTVNRFEFRRYNDFMRRIRELQRHIFETTEAETVSCEFVPINKTVIVPRTVLDKMRQRGIDRRPVSPKNDDVPPLPRSNRYKRRR